jgi:hypothetical protein
MAKEYVIFFFEVSEKRQNAKISADTVLYRICFKVNTTNTCEFGQTITSYHNFEFLKVFK